MGRTVLILRPCADTDDVWTPGLEQLGYTVLYAEEANQALCHVRTACVDCVVIDSAGRENERVTQFVGLLRHEREAPPLVLVSSSPEAPIFSAKLGAAAFVPKPCGIDELCLVLGRMSPDLVETASARL